MSISELVWKLFLLLLPGVIAVLMQEQINVVKHTNFKFIINAALYGVATFIIMEIFYSIFIIVMALFYKYKLCWGLNLSIWDGILNGSNQYNKIELFLSYIFSIPIGFFFGFLSLRNYPLKFFKWLGLTNRYGDDDVWSFYLNSPDVNWVLVRDKKDNLTYFGKIRAYSDTGIKREILLSEVEVFTSDDWIPLYESESIYLEMDKFNFSIESPKPQNNEPN